MFDEEGSRQLVMVDTVNEAEHRFTDSLIDDRNPVWSPYGQSLIYTSFRDNVPNIFVVSVTDSIGTEERVTALFSGATALQWLPADSLHPAGRIVVSATDTKTDNRFYLLDASQRAAQPAIAINPSYEKWLTHQPPNRIDRVVTTDASLITSVSRYAAFKNLSHVTTIPFPYYTENSGFGIGALTLFTEPLAKHEITAFAALSTKNFLDYSIFYLNYVNNTLRPSLSFNFYRNSFTGRFYDDDYLVTSNSGAYLLASLPRDWIDSPFVNSTLFTRVRYEFTNSKRYWDRDIRTPVLSKPENGWQADLQTGLRMTSQKPYRFNQIHPLDGWGFESKLTLASTLLSSASDYVQPDIVAYTILPAVGQSRFYVYGRAIARWGSGLPQDYIGFGKFDELSFGSSLPGLEILYNNVERVRGFSDYVPGNRLLFGTLEYRLPLTNDLQTRILGLFSLGRTTLAAFVDGGVVWSDSFAPENDAVSRAGTGIELKNVLTIGGVSFIHNLGFAQPVQDAFSDRNQEIYYRFKTVIPF